MALFKKRNKIESSKSKVLDKPKLILGENIDKKKMEEIVKTTDSMQVVASSFKNSQDKDSQRVEEASKALLRSYDLAIRKISNTYEEIIETKKVVSNDFLTVQIMIRDYEKNHDIDSISKTIDIFSEELEHQLANGKSIKIDEKLIIEPADYVNKMIPIARFVTDKYVNVNTVSWDEIAKVLQQESVISSADVETIETLIEAIMTNIDNGYYVKFGNIVIARVRPESSDLMILFSRETINRLNKIYSGDRLRRRSKVISKNNYITSFKDSKENKAEEDEKLMNELGKDEVEGKRKRNKKIKAVLQREKEIGEKITTTVENAKEQEVAIKESLKIKAENESKNIEEVVLDELNKKEKKSFFKKNKKEKDISEEEITDNEPLEKESHKDSVKDVKDSKPTKKANSKENKKTDSKASKTNKKTDTKEAKKVASKPKDKEKADKKANSKETKKTNSSSKDVKKAKKVPAKKKK